MGNQRNFGGSWSDQKLAALKSYLAAYNTALSNQHFTRIYIDAFAGAGREEVDASEEAYRHGSPLIARDTSPQFDRFIFIEKNHQNLSSLKTQFGEDSRPVDYHCADANDALIDVCQKTAWRHNRAVAFLDPFALQVRWETIQAIAATEAIDMWLLFPSMAVNRMLARSGELDSTWKTKLDVTFGRSDWKEIFYRREEPDLFGERRIQKNPKPFDILSSLVTEQLESEFPAVLNKPLELKTPGGSPIFFLCFAAANKGKGGEIALSIASHIVRNIK